MRKFDEVSFDDFDEENSPKPAVDDFDRVLEAALSRRDLFKGVVALGGITALGSNFFTQPLNAAESRFAFDEIAANSPVSYTHLTLPTICSV